MVPNFDFYSSEYLKGEGMDPVTIDAGAFYADYAFYPFGDSEQITLKSRLDRNFKIENRNF